MSTRINKDLFELFYNNPELSKEEFDKYFDANQETLLDKNQAKNIIVMSFNGKVENLYLYEKAGFLEETKTYTVDLTYTEE